MGTLYLATTIINRKAAKKYTEVFLQNNILVNYTMLATGTASSDILDYLGLESSDKTVILSVVEEELWQQTKKQLQQKLQIDAPGEGIAFTIPLSSVGGKKTLQFLVGKQDYQKEEESTLKDTAHELLVIIANQGNIESIMDAARSAGAYGGTVLHAKGTGMEQAEKFMGVSLAAEREMILIVTRKEEKNTIMKAIMEQTGIETEAKAIVFSLPVTDTAGLRLIEE